SGIASLHIGIALAHLVRKGQPLGGSNGLGISPLRIICSRFCSMNGSGIGTADINACVYGCNGFRYNASLDASSTALPKYITKTRSLIYLTIDNSWAINKYVRSCSCCNSFNQLIVCA